MINYGLKDKVAIITGANNPQGIGATTALAFAREGAKVVLIYKKINRPFVYYESFQPYSTMAKTPFSYSHLFS